jgi:REP-associated tyrosine transposase
VRRLGDLLEQIVAEHCWQMVAKEVMPDQVHLFVRVGRQEFPYLRNHVEVAWSPSYFAASGAYASESRVRRDVEHRWDAVRAS